MLRASREGVLDANFSKSIAQGQGESTCPTQVQSPESHKVPLAEPGVIRTITRCGPKPKQTGTQFTRQRVLGLGLLLEVSLG